MDEAIKKRQTRAKAAAIKILKDAGYFIIPSDNNNFCVIGTRTAEVRFVKVVVDEITQGDIDAIKDVRIPRGGCIKEIWCRHGEEFEIHEILN